MVYSYTPTYYTTLHDSITSLCKTLLPFGFKKRSLPASEHKLLKLQSDNLKWQQDSFHQMLNLMGLHKEGILAPSEVSTFTTHLLETLIVSPPEQEHPVILRDKLLFLQELLHAKCISEEEYHASKRPLLQRLAVQGAEMESTDVIIAGSKGTKENSEPEWSVIDLKGEQCLLNKENSNSKNKSKQGSAVKQIKGPASVFSFVSSHKPGKNRIEKSIFDSPSLHLDSIPSKFSSSVSTRNELRYSNENPFWDGQSKNKESEGSSVLLVDSGPPEPMKESGGTDKLKRKPFRTLFHREQKEGHDGVGDRGPEPVEKSGKSAKKQWGFKKWKKNDSDDETAPLPLNERSDSEAYLASSQLFTRPLGEGPDTKLIKKKLHYDASASDLSVDKVSGVKKELSRIQTELSTTNPNLTFSSWSDRQGDAVLNVVKKESKDNVGEMENTCNNDTEKYSNSMQWTTFEDDENFHPNLFVHRDSSFRSSSINPFSLG